MLMWAVNFVIAFSIGYCVREVISRHRRKKYVRSSRRADGPVKNELEIFKDIRPSLRKTIHSSERQERRRKSKTAVSRQKLPERSE